MTPFETLTGVAAPLMIPNIDTEVLIRIDRLMDNRISWVPTALSNGAIVRTDLKTRILCLIKNRGERLRFLLPVPTLLAVLRASMR